ncbi:MAG: type VI secretion system tip protein TssI/VgrG [Myxococcales bacterium]
MIGSRTISIIPPKEAGTLMLERLIGGEILGRLFEFDIELLSKDGEIKIADVLGKPFSLALSRGQQPPRWFNGIVTRFAMAGWIGEYFRYHAKVRPQMWLLTRTSNCRIFQGKSVPDVIMKLLGDHGVTAKKQLGRDSYVSWEYLVQYNETDFNFVSRLMEQEGIFYYFLHEEGKHTVVLVDALTVHDNVTGHEKIRFSAAGERATIQEEHEHIDNWSLALQVEPGAYVGKEFDFERPRAPLLSNAKAPNPHIHADAEKFEYPGRYVLDAERGDYAERRLQEQQVEYEVVEGTGNARGLMPGFLFSLTDHPSNGQNREYLVTAAHYALTSNLHGSGGDTAADYRCSFSGIPSKRPYRTPLMTQKPLVTGSQTAIVVGPKGEEIWTDKYGRVKVQFHWDRQGARDENSSCWVRVSQIWAGTQWGAIHIPRIGQEVLVDFLEGDPDRPIITGRVYNADNMPPYKLPDNKTQSGIKSRSTLAGGPSNFNELRFEDKKGAEQLYLQAEKNQDNLVKNDATLTVGHDRTKAIGNDETVTVGGNRTETVTKDESETIKQNQTTAVTIDRTVTVGGNQTVAVTGNHSVTVSKNQTTTISIACAETVGAAKALTVGAAYQVSVGAAMNETVGGLKAEEIGGLKSVNVGGISSENVGGNKSVNAKGGISETAGKDIAMKAGANLAATAAKNVTLNSGAIGMFEAKDELTLKCGDASIVMKSNGDISIKGKKITVNGSGDVAIKGSKIGQN